ncbi:tyrosine-type recombinase/integrase [Clostridium butyricum]
MKISLKANTHRSIDEAFEQFMLEHCKLKNLRPSTEKHYREFVNYSLYKFLDKDSNVSLLTQEVVHNYILWLQKQTIRDTTVNIYIKAFKTVIRFFKSKNWIDKNITLSLIKTDMQEIQPYTDEEIEILIRKPNMNNTSFCEYRNWVIVNFFCNTGCRRSTLVNIQLEDLDLDNGYCYFRHVKNRKPFTVPISPTMVNILKEYISYLPQGCIYLFPTVTGTQIKPRGFTRAIEDYNKNRGVFRTSVHAFRHWYCKKSVLLGVDIVRLSKLIGHSNLETLRVYVQLLTQDLKVNEINLNPLENMNKKSIVNKRIKLK